MDVTDRYVTFSIRRLADEFGIGRDTIAKRLAQYGVRPCGERASHPVYRLSEAVPAILSIRGVDEEGNPDPRNLPPMQRNAWYQSEQRRIDLGLSSGELIPASQHEADLAVMTRDLAQFLETLPDQLERDVGLTPEQVQALHDGIDRRRQDLYDRIIAEATQSSGPNKASASD